MRSLTVFMTLFLMLVGVRQAYATKTIPVPVECPAPMAQTYTTVRGDRLNGTEGVLARFGTTIDELRGANPGVLVPVARLSIAPGSPYQATSVTVAVSHLRWYLPPGKTITIPASRAALEAQVRCEQGRVTRLDRELQTVRAERDDARRQLTQARTATASAELQRAFDARDHRRTVSGLATVAIAGLIVAFLGGVFLASRRRNVSIPKVAAPSPSDEELNARARALDRRSERLAAQERHVTNVLADFERQQDQTRAAERELADVRVRLEGARLGTIFKNRELDAAVCDISEAQDRIARDEQRLLARAKGLDSREASLVDWELRLQEWEQELASSGKPPPPDPLDSDSTRDLSSAASQAVALAGPKPGENGDRSAVSGPILGVEEAGAQSYHSLPPSDDVRTALEDDPASGALEVPVVH